MNANDRLQATIKRLTRERDEARAEVAALKANGVPGVMHEIDRAFYELTVKERDYERTRCLRVERDLAAARAEIAALEKQLDRAHG